MNDLYSTFRVNTWFFDIVTGAFVSATVTLFIVAWEWLENPGGIYRDANGTNLGIVFDTAISWLVPMFFWQSSYRLGSSFDMVVEPTASTPGLK